MKQKQDIKLTTTKGPSCPKDFVRESPLTPSCTFHSEFRIPVNQFAGSERTMSLRYVSSVTSFFGFFTPDNGTRSKSFRSLLCLFNHKRLKSNSNARNLRLPRGSGPQSDEICIIPSSVKSSARSRAFELSKDQDVVLVYSVHTTIHCNSGNTWQCPRCRLLLFGNQI